MIFSLQDFLRRVGEEEEAGPEEAHVRAVCSALDEAMSGGGMRDVRRQFPSELGRLFG